MSSTSSSGVLARADVDADGVDELLRSSSSGLSFIMATGEKGELVAWPGARAPRWIDLAGEQAELMFLDDQDMVVAARCEERRPFSCDVEASAPAPEAEEFAVTDFDEDGRLDVVVLSSEHDFYFVFGLVEAERTVAEREERFSTRWATYPRTKLAVGDLDADGHDDIVVLGLELEIFFGDGQGDFPVTRTFQLPEHRYVRRLALASLGDGLVHIVTDQAIFVNLGDRQFDDGGSTPYTDNDLFAVGDFSLDEGAEILVYPHPTDSVPQAAIVSRAVDGEWVLRPIALDLEPEVLGVVVADLDGNGIDDLAVASGSGLPGGCE